MDTSVHEPRLRHEVAGVGVIFGALIFLLALLSFSPSDEGLLGRGLAVHNWIGAGGVWISNKTLVGAFGLAGYIFPFSLFYLGGLLFAGRVPESRGPLLLRLACGLLFWLFSASALALTVGEYASGGQEIPAGGLVGILLGGALRQGLGFAGAASVIVFGLLAGFMLFTHVSLKAVLAGLWDAMAPLRARLHAALEARRTQIEREKREEHVAQLRKTIEAAHVQAAPTIVLQPQAEVVAIDAKLREPKKKKKEKTPEKKQEAFGFAKDAAEHEPAPLPSTDLLEFEPSVNQPVDGEQLKANAKILEKKLLDFGIQGQVVAIQPGPVITMYEFRPAPGVKVSKIANLQDDLAMALSAVSIRIIAPIPGKDVVGIEIPNRYRQKIFLRELLENDEFQSARNKADETKILLALGKDTSGVPFYWDLKKMPHLLIAGTTGAGKSVGLNTMILSILYKHQPSDVKLILIDPKRLELSVYEGIPHLYASVVTDPKKAASALRWAVGEMMRRYDLLSEYGKRNLEGYNQAVRKEMEDGSWRERAARKAEAERQKMLAAGGEEGALAADPRQAELLTPPEHLPTLIIVIDELADLMMVMGKEVEDSIIRLAQLARASGIHLIVATQRPSVDVITGLIKANLPTRISFQVRSNADSRTILDTPGAEQLLGQGDMLFLPSGSSKLQRVHGAFVSDDEVHRVTQFLQGTGEAHYNDAILDVPADMKTEIEAEGDEPPDPLYEQAVRVVVESGQASTSYVQRRLKVGYNRAARMIERMERDGIVGPTNGVTAREILVDLLQIEEKFKAAG